MTNFSSWKMWMVLAGTLLVVTITLYLVYVADIQASKKVALSQAVPKLGVEETEKECLQRLESQIPSLMNDPLISQGIPAVDFEQHPVPVLITPVRYATLNSEAYLSRVQDYATQSLPSCMHEVDGYTLENVQVRSFNDPEGPFTLNLQYRIRWENKILKESHIPLMIYFNPFHLFAFTNDYVEAGRMLPALRLKTLEELAIKYRVWVEIYGLGDTVVFKLQDLETAKTTGNNAVTHALIFAVQFPWEQPVRGAELKEANQLQSSEQVKFKEGKFWIVPN